METVPLALQAPDPQWNIRPAVLTDAADLHQYCWHNRAEMLVERLLRRAVQHTSQRRGLGVVAEVNGAACAYGQFVRLPRCAEISDLIVTEALRGQGIGTAIIQYLVRYAASSGVRCIEIGAACSNPGAVLLYQRLGFREHRRLTADLGQGKEPVVYLKLEL